MADCRSTDDGPSVICIGEALVDLLAPVGVALKDAREFTLAPGGAPANVAVGLTRLGVRASFAGKVGDDPFGSLLHDTLQRAGVDISHLRVTSDARTTLAWVARPTADTPEFLFYRNPGADALLRADELDPAYLLGASIVHFGSLSLSAEPARSATLAAIGTAREAGRLVSYDPNWRPDVWSSASEGHAWMLEGLARADLVKVNEAELTLLTGSPDPPEGAGELLDRGAKLVVVTGGGSGAYFANSRARGFVPAFEVSVIDTTGCGDAFTAALLVQVLDAPQPLEHVDDTYLRAALRFANAAAALTATRQGVIPALPDRAQVEVLCRGEIDVHDPLDSR